MKDEITSIRSTGNVFADGGLPDAEIRYAKSQLALTIIKAMREQGITQTELAKRVGLSQPRISLMCGAPTSETSIEAMLKVLAALDYDVSITLKRRQEPTVQYLPESEENSDAAVKGFHPIQKHSSARSVFSGRAKREKVTAGG